MTPSFLLSPILQYVGIAYLRQNVLMTSEPRARTAWAQKKKSFFLCSGFRVCESCWMKVWPSLLLRRSLWKRNCRSMSCLFWVFGLLFLFCIVCNSFTPLTWITAPSLRHRSTCHGKNTSFLECNCFIVMRQQIKEKRLRSTFHLSHLCEFHVFWLCVWFGVFWFAFGFVWFVCSFTPRWISLYSST